MLDAVDTLHIYTIVHYTALHYTQMHAHACIHTHTQSLWQPCETQLLPPSEPTLRCLCTTTQALEFCASNSFWSKASNPLENCPSLTERGHRILSSTATPTQTRTVEYLLP